MRPMRERGLLQELAFQRDASSTFDIVGCLPAVCQHGALWEGQTIMCLAQLNGQGAYAIICEVDVCMFERGTGIALVQELFVTNGCIQGLPA